jgi:hypothetical protein
VASIGLAMSKTVSASMSARSAAEPEASRVCDHTWGRASKGTACVMLG